MSWLSNILGGGKAPERHGGPAKAGNTTESALQLIIDRKEYPIAELAVRSFRVLPYDGDLIAKQSFGFTMVLKVGGEEYRSSGHGTVRVNNEKDGLVAQFTAPSPAFDKKLMEHLARTTSHNRSHAPCKPARGH